MSLTQRSRAAETIPIANVAVPTILIVIVLLVGGLGVLGIAVALVYLFRRLSDRME